MTIYEIIESIAATASTNAKKEIIEANKNNDILRNVFHYAYNPRYNYWIKPGPLSNIENSGSDITLATLDSLRVLIDRKITGNDARTYFENVLKPLSSQAREILCRILNHDLRCGASDTLAGKTWKNLVPEYPVMLCEKYNEKTEKYLKKFEGVVPFVVDCLSSDWEVDTNIGKIKISDIVNNKIQCSVKSYNETTREIEYNKVVNWFDDGETTENWFTITYTSTTDLVKKTKPVTGNHKLLTSNRGWVRVNQLTSFDTILQS